ncbi:MULTISPECIES: acyltransferase [unclassified Pseudoalteromonas]|uniref:acyltransferase family protein n=1 Tax=unclassified Pseudoalteromonas TaxID=194690 RepID=UPI0011099220|nr:MULTISPECIES: acyltransferase [unclassified Pseudoalteromonas]TMN81308.1 hypothetical protein CWB64_12110 [Pseudoalteromonas sp. S410]TMN89289.1 hypothetical protein CWB62_13100 [Pseudoalteromonas sp. S408]TMN95067.1 hypothetical protein CWB61_15995 [Pseudoalteromonas sp. S407]TMN96534.1 hypothetical protein CWB63_15640 [Pseudoalteromonas sp. S409]TMO07789.1 hypothetical protein CWB57_15310 [Pseudoalteromonas sp. S186]
MNSKKEYLHSLNWFRGLAILFVVMTHTPLNGLLEYRAGVYLAAYFQNGTAFFVFIAGYLFWHQIHKYNYFTFIKNKINNVVSPYLLILTITLLSVYILSKFGVNSIDYSRFDYQVSFENLLSNNGFIWHYLKGGAINYPLWFIPMITIFFITSPLTVFISRTRYFGFVLVITLIYTSLSERGDWATSQYAHYLGVFLLGIFCKKNQKVIFDKALLFLFISLPLSLLFLYWKVNYDESMFNYSALEKLASVLFYISLFMFLEKMGYKFKALDVLAKYSFGIFFIHYYFLILFTLLFSKLGLEDSLHEFVFTFTLSVLLATVASYLVKLASGKYSKNVLGV